MEQLTLWKPPEKEIKFEHFAFASSYSRDNFSHCGRWMFVEGDGEIKMFPHHPKSSMYTDYFTGRLKFTMRPVCRVPPSYAPDDTPAPKPSRKKKRKTPKPYKWSRQAKVRNRQRLLRKRIEKKHGYDPQHPDLFDGEILIAIEAEFQEQIAENPDYFIKGENL